MGVVFDFDSCTHTEDKNPNFRSIFPLYNWDYNCFWHLFLHYWDGDMWEGSFFQIVMEGQNYMTGI